MSTLNDATSRNVSEKQHQQRKEENTHEQKHGYENAQQKDKHKKRHEKKKNSNTTAAATTATNIGGGSNSSSSGSSSSSSNSNNSIRNLSNITLATQFSIQRTDSDGCLRMKISAIRPTTTITATAAAATKAPVSTPNIVVNPTALQKTYYTKSKNFKDDKTLLKNNNNTLETLKVKISPTRNKAETKTANMSSVIVNPLSKNRKDILQLPLTVPASGVATTTTATTTMACLSDATDSGCSEATNTTIATVGQEKISKRKIKRKKVLLKANETKRALKTLKPIEIALENPFSTDSEDEPLAQKLSLVTNVEAITQRAPRLLLTAINTKNLTSNLSTTSAPLNSTLGSLQHGNEHIGLSSSDNELPNVRAAIERVVGETDEDDNLSTSNFHKAKTKHLPQYQSTLLQDFMEKTQMLGQQPPNSSDSVKAKNSFIQNDILLQTINTNSQSDSIASSSASNTKKRRGRPKKPDKEHELTLNSMSPVHANNKNSNINESADSGVISTTSVSTQSTSPHPCTTLASSSANDNTSSTNSPNKNLISTPEKHTTETSSTSSTNKPKIDIALLDKRMYATERVLYPPPRNKRRQSTSAAIASVSEKQKLAQAQQQSSKDDMQLDPVWRKIDVNRKFRRPSVCSTTGYKSDGGADERVRERSSKSTVCSKVLAAKSGYVSDYGTSSFRLSRHSKHASHNSGYKSDASCKSRYSTKSCASRKSRAKSCGYRSDCKESVLGTSKSSKFRRKRRASIMQKSMGSLKDEQDILQLAGLSLGQSSEESNEYVCKPSLEKLPTTSASKKYGEINRYIATGEYFGRGSSGQHNSHNSFASISHNNTRIFDVATDLPQTPAKITLLQRKNSTTSEFAHDLLQLPGSNQTARKIKSRRSSVASFCSSYYSAGTTKLKRRRKRKNFRFHNSSSSKNSVIDSKLLTEIEILTNTFSSRCKIHSSSITDKLTGGNLSQKEKLMAEATKLQQSLAAAAAAAASTSTASTSKRDSRDKRSVKKRKISENLDFAMLSARAESNSLTPGSSSGQGSSSKRRHKKASSSSPDDHKLPLKKRHYLLTPGEKSSEVAVAVAAKLFANNAEAWAAAAAAAKSTANTKSQQQFNAKTAKANLTPKKRHLLQQPPHTLNEDSNSNKTASTLSPLRVTVGDPNSISGGKLLDISPQSLNSLKQVTEAVHKKRSRLEGVVSKIATTHGEEITKSKTNVSSSLQIESESSSCPPPGVFEPSVELEIQIPPITKYSEATSNIITKSEVDSPLLMDLNKGFADATSKSSGNRVVESLLNKTGGNLILRRKRKINRTGFPTKKRKKRKINENLNVEVNGQIEQTADNTNIKVIGVKTPEKQCDRVPQQGETSQTFLERNNRTPRLSVVALERLQESPLSSRDKTSPKELQQNAEALATPKTRHTRHVTKRKSLKEEKPTALKESKTITETGKKEQPQQQQLQQHEADDDDKPLASRARRTKTLADIKDTSSKSSPSRKSLVSKTAKSLLEANIKLPAGVDPKSILSCKIKLKRRNSIHPLAARKSPVTLPDTQPIITEIPRTAEEIEMDAKAKNCNIDYLEQDILPISESQLNNLNGDTEASDTSDEKSSTNSSVTKKIKPIRKTYLPAGLFSDYFKVNQTVTKRNANKKDNEKKTDLDKTTTTNCTEVVNQNKEIEVFKGPLLPPPPYCEKYLRRTQYDFELPYDIWWAYKNSKLPNRITVPSWNFRKIRTNIYAENVKPPPIAANDHPMCNCKPDVGCGDNCLNRMVYTECSPSNCPTREKCRNQKIQKHDIAPGVERFMTENKGWGVRTKLPIEKGTYILEYVGEVVTEREFKDRMATIYLNDTHHYCLHLDGGLVIDGQRMGSDCRFVNHSCEPNCEMQKWSVNGLCRMALFAKRKIAEGEELTYDYNFSLFNPSEGQPCRCNTPNCRGVIGGKTQRVKPLPMEAKPANDTPTKDDQKGRQRKRKARKNTQRQTTKDVATPTRMQPLSEKEKKLIKQYSIFLVRNFEKIRARKAKRKANAKAGSETPKPQTPTNIATTLTVTSSAGTTPAAITQRRPSTPASLVAQISALCTARNIKTRGLTLAVHDPEVEKMAKMAKILRDICTNLEQIKNPQNEQQSLVTILSNPAPSTAGTNKKKKASLKVQQKQEATDFKTIQNNIEQGYYKLPAEFNTHMQKLFEEAKVVFGKKEVEKLNLIQLLEKAFIEEKHKHYTALLELLQDENLLKDFEDSTQKALAINTHKKEAVENSSTSNSPIPLANNIAVNSSNEDIIRCICGLFRDEGLMIQCARCMVWQHTECTKADVNAENYLCEQCEPREVDREIPLDDYTEEGYRYYLTLMRGSSLQVRQGDAVYVLRDIPVKDATGNVVPSKKHTYETIGDVDYNECDIFRVERLWKDDDGKRFIFGHHFLRPHETFHEPSRKFYPNEVVRVPLYEVVPIDLVMGRCWVLDRTTFCKGRPIECNDETHCFICELRVDKSARFFSKAKTNHPTCTKSYAFRKFNEKLKISKTYAPHDVDPSMLKPKKQKTDSENQTTTTTPTATTPLLNSNAASGSVNSRQELNKTPQSLNKKRQGSKSPATITPTQNQALENHSAPAPMTVKEKRLHLENVLKTIKSIRTTNQEPPLDLTYLLTGRGARQRKTLTSSANSN
ncbi:histone-lysine N-methyltransferase ash1 [Lucilia cuprina]|uniref:histone-lysine N-methyltransferase ash1 n=1 Tax=Lucilia cuprina TaxID=7375 RepID=UPI001F05AF5C|nr:histone-lysine N-methyltransferase ash1 [Lucilia cuprina]